MRNIQEENIQEETKRLREQELFDILKQVVDYYPNALKILRNIGIKLKDQRVKNIIIENNKLFIAHLMLILFLEKNGNLDELKFKEEEDKIYETMESLGILGDEEDKLKFYKNYIKILQKTMKIKVTEKDAEEILKRRQDGTLFREAMGTKWVKEAMGTKGIIGKTRKRSETFL